MLVLHTSCHCYVMCCRTEGEVEESVHGATSRLARLEQQVRGVEAALSDSLHTDISHLTQVSLCLVHNDIASLFIKSLIQVEELV